ncbi:MAG: diguanylate cyclase [Gammaproteobacteria bacterium]|nr:diguanylate cyclase [Gammaproteobacteria bacterium]MBU1415808.1 diguanylate cyclase [Gammaproteobacteria bacterium]
MTNQNFFFENEVATMNEDTAAWEKFLYVLEWVLAVQVRYANNLRHSLVSINFHDQKTLGDTYGAKDALQMLIALAGQLRSSLRKTDLVARNGTTIWVMIPFVTPESVLSKVSQIVEIAAANGLDIVDRDISIYSIPDAGILEGQDFKTAEDFLDFIGEQKNVAMRWEGCAKTSN